MLRPSYSDILDVITQDAEDITLGSRYTIVIAAAKRARQLIDHAEPLTDKTEIERPVSIAVNELYEGKIVIKQGSKEEFEETAEEKADSNDAVPVEPEFLDTMEE